MKRFLIVGALTLCVASFVHSNASAQMTVQVTDINGKNPQQDKVRMSKAGCQLPVNLYINNIPTNNTQLDLWIGDGCNDQAKRGGTTKTCDYLGELSIPSGGQAMIMDFAATVKMNKNIDITGANFIPACSATCDTSKFPNACQKNGEGDQSIFILSSSTAMNTGDVSSYVSFTIYYDPVAPNAPTNVSINSGETQANISWDSDIKGSTDLGSDFKVYVDTQPTSGSPCASSSLTAGQSAPATSATVAESSTGNISTTSKAFDISKLKLSVGSYAAVAVTAVDRAGNESVLSEVQCFQVINTVGFWERYGGTGNGSSGCRIDAATTPRDHVTHAAWMVVLGLALIARSRRIQ